MISAQHPGNLTFCPSQPVEQVPKQMSKDKSRLEFEYKPYSGVLVPMEAALSLGSGEGVNGLQNCRLTVAS